VARILSTSSPDVLAQYLAALHPLPEPRQRGD